MKVMIVGAGAREHAIAWKIRTQRPEVQLILAPGNAGSLMLGQQGPGADDQSALVSFARENAVDLTIVGPEGPLAGGLVDRFAAAGLRAFGPTAAAAEIEASKAWAKAFMARHRIPTAAFTTCVTLAEATEWIESASSLPVVKDDALAAGKGVTVPETKDEALLAVNAILGPRGSGKLVLEERLYGWELSALAFCDGQTALLMPPACDYKRLLDGDQGPNTGGMGAYASPALSPELRARILEEILHPAVRGLKAEGRPFTGVLYAGLMMTPEGPKTIEFNCRFGDPETQAILPLLESDFIELVQACLDGRLEQIQPRWKEQRSCAVVLTSPGYPDRPEPAPDPIGWDHLTEATAFRGGSSGRFLTVSAVADSLDEARERAYSAASRVAPPGTHYRRDIAAWDRATGPQPLPAGK